ncbi:predicted protein [Candida tropicalis MYA-3404]|uniref:Cell division control protein 14 n=1 Tax=Candida tropicalis (strain ATCC MYA-3404 / T1) TaxID=294747 RepID=C5M6Y8_CANTT|nr:predicted protein [Candida tropicalis MYA-3404]EER34758.1 predicted protein [Candida tropicalis MYA-3404]KAG4408635.1 hypothetical protein JTP64_001941 [Candida tropicalis]
MDKDIIEIIDLLTSNELPTISQGLNELNNLLSSLIPFIKQYQTTSSISSKLEQFENLQNSFQYNLAQHLVPLYSYDLNVDQFLLCNKLLQGLLLIHPNSRSIFNLSKNMKYVIDLLESNLNIKLTISLISTLIHILLKNFENYRVFEKLNGCSVLIKHFKLSSFEKIQDGNEEFNNNLNFKIIEFLMLYLLEEPKGGKSINEKSQFFVKDFPEIDSLIENLSQLYNL